MFVAGAVASRAAKKRKQDYLIQDKDLKLLHPHSRLSSDDPPGAVQSLGLPQPSSTLKRSNQQ